MMSISLFYTVPLVMFMLMIVTKSYKKSISNAVSVTALLVAGYIYQYSEIYSFLVMWVSIFAMQLRAIVNHDDDKLLKR